jgi:hypothetical protein
MSNVAYLKVFLFLALGYISLMLSGVERFQALAIAVFVYTVVLAIDGAATAIVAAINKSP